MTKNMFYGTIGLDDVVPCGVYQGTQLWEVIEKDPKYVNHMISEYKLFELDNEAYEQLQKLL